MARDAYAGYAATDCIGKSGTVFLSIGDTAKMLQAILALCLYELHGNSASLYECKFEYR